MIAFHYAKLRLNRIFIRVGRSEKSFRPFQSVGNDEQELRTPKSPTHSRANKSANIYEIQKVILTRLYASNNVLQMAERAMELRNHPLIKSYCGKTNWPPAWVPVDRKPDQVLVGEIGILRLARYRIGYPTRCHLVIDHENTTLVGTLLFDDSAFCWALVKELRNCLGLSIEEIGGLDLSFML